MSENIFEKDLSIIEATPLPNGAKIKTVFSNGEYGVIDMTAEIEKRKGLSNMKDPDFFAKCAILHDGHTLCWPGDIIMVWDTLYHLAQKQGVLMSGDTMTAKEFKVWLKTVGLKQLDVAEKFGYSPRQITKFATGKAEIPPIVRLACLAVQAGLDQPSR